MESNRAQLKSDLELFERQMHQTFFLEMDLMSLTLELISYPPIAIRNGSLETDLGWLF